MYEKEKIITVKEEPKNVESNFDEKNFIIFTILILKTLKKNLNDVSLRLNANLKIHMGLTIKII